MKRAVLILSAILSAISVLILTLLFFYFSVTAGVRLDPGKLKAGASAVRVYDAQGGEITLPALKRSTALDGLPEYLPNAFVAVEDKRFYAHDGFDYKRIGKAVFKNLTSLSFREGASTISQQLIKNTHLSGEKTIRRKLREMKLTRALERNYSKKEILSLYLNSIYFGHSAFGIEDAASYYFQKQARELTPAESATLAALVRSPNRYSPFVDAEKCLKRRNFVLSLMLGQGYLSREEYDGAVAEPLPVTQGGGSGSGGSYLSLVFSELASLFPDGNTETANLTIETFCDPKLQKSLEESHAETDFISTVADNRTHAILAYHSTAGLLRRLPASLMKPLLVYAPAIEENLVSPATPVADEKTDFGGYSPRNYGDEYAGYLSVRNALARSANVPAVRILNALGVEKGARYLEKMQLGVGREDLTLALALGGMKEGYSLPELVSAYSTFPRMGSFAPARTIKKISTADGRVLYEFHPKEERVFSEDTACLVNDMLETAVKSGTAKKLKALGFPVAAKTGTGEGEGGNSDAYTLSYTTEHTVGVWMGMRDYSPVRTTGGGAPASLAFQIMKQLYRGRAPGKFPAAEGVIPLAFDREEYEKNHRLLLADPEAPALTTLTELFRASGAPTEVSTRFSCPVIQKPALSVKNGCVSIILCQTEYYDYVIKRKSNGKTVTVYEGKYRTSVTDNSVSGGNSYEYSVTPYYRGKAGETVYLPSVYLEKQKELPKDWWAP